MSTSLRSYVARVSVDAHLRPVFDRFLQLERFEQRAVHKLMGDFLAAEPVAVENGDLERRLDALAVMRAAAVELDLQVSAGLKARAFDRTNAARQNKWTSSKIVRLFGRWSFACAELGGQTRVSAAQRALMRASRAGRVREIEDYLEGLRLWLSTNPSLRRIVDYDAWRREHNASLPAGERAVASASMLRKAFRCSWSDLLEVAAGRLTLEEATARAHAIGRTTTVRRGPHQLASFQDVKRLLDLSTTAARNATTRSGFPRPAYTQRRPPHLRLWRLRDIERYVAGASVRRWARNDLQEVYLDRHQVADLLGLAPITVTTLSSPQIPDPAISLSGFHLWLRADVEHAAGRRPKA